MDLAFPELFFQAAMRLSSEQAEEMGRSFCCCLKCHQGHTIALPQGTRAQGLVDHQSLVARTEECPEKTARRSSCFSCPQWSNRRFLCFSNACSQDLKRLAGCSSVGTGYRNGLPSSTRNTWLREAKTHPETRAWSAEWGYSASSSTQVRSLENGRSVL